MGETSVGAGGAEAPDVLGKVASPPHKESTSDEFYFWAGRGVVVEKSEIVYADCVLGGEVVRFYGLVNEVLPPGPAGEHRRGERPPRRRPRLRAAPRQFPGSPTPR